MKKLLFGAAAIMLMISCSGNGTTEKTNEDSANIADSVAQIDTAKVKAEVEKAYQDSIQQDSIAKAEAQTKAAAQYDDLIKEYASAIVTFKNRAIRTYGDYQSYKLFLKCKDLEKKLNKQKDKMTSEQLSKFKSEKSKLKKYQGYIEP